MYLYRTTVTFKTQFFSHSVFYLFFFAFFNPPDARARTFGTDAVVFSESSDDDEDID